MLAALAVLAVATAALPRKGTLALADAVRAADVIVVGHVERVIDVERSALTLERRQVELDLRLRFAEVAVERGVAGDADLRRLWFLASPTWVCDSTRAVVGERTLFVLTELATLAPGAAPAYVSSAAEPSVAPAEVVHQLVGSGDGRIPIARVDGGERVSASHFHLPDELKRQLLADATGTARHARQLELATLLAWIEATVSAQSPCLIVDDPGRGDGDLPWRLHVCNDGAARVRIGTEAGKDFSVAADALRELRSIVEHAEVAALPRVLGWAALDERAITLEVRELRSRTSVRLEGLHHSRGAPVPPALRLALPIYVAARGVVESSGVEDAARAADARPMCIDLLARRR
jgi:hypothetical protein